MRCSKLLGTPLVWYAGMYVGRYVLSESLTSLNYLHNYLQISVHSKVDSRSSLIRVLWSLGSDTTLAEEDPNERRIVYVWPVSDRERQRVCVMVWRVTKLEVSVH